MELTQSSLNEQMPSPVQGGEQGGRKAKKIGTYVLLGLVVVTGLLAIYFYRQLSDLRQDPQKVAQEEATKLVETVGKLIRLPEGEQPTIATVTDPSQLAGQAFFANAKTGDKVMIYATAKKAILYSPSENKIVEVAPLSIGNPQ